MLLTASRTHDELLIYIHTISVVINSRSMPRRCISQLIIRAISSQMPRAIRSYLLRYVNNEEQCHASNEKLRFRQHACVCNVILIIFCMWNAKYYHTKEKQSIILGTFIDPLDVSLMNSGKKRGHFPQKPRFNEANCI